MDELPPPIALTRDWGIFWNEHATAIYDYLKGHTTTFPSDEALRNDFTQFTRNEHRMLPFLPYDEKRRYAHLRNHCNALGMEEEMKHSTSAAAMAIGRDPRSITMDTGKQQLFPRQHTGSCHECAKQFYFGRASPKRKSPKTHRRSPKARRSPKGRKSPKRKSPRKK
jgi:hypothetical protein